MPTITPPDRIHFTGDPDADALLAREPIALLIGFELDQQVTVQKAFSGPLYLKRRIGTLDPRVIAAMDASALESAFRERPALHRFPGTMAARVQELAGVLVRDYDGDAARIWLRASDAHDLEKRLLGLPGIGPMKAKAIIAILGKRFGLTLPGWDEVAPDYPTLGDVDSPESLAEYQAGKRAYKQMLKETGGTFDPAARRPPA